MGLFSRSSFCFDLSHLQHSFLSKFCLHHPTGQKRHMLLLQLLQVIDFKIKGINKSCVCNICPLFLLREREKEEKDSRPQLCNSSLSTFFASYLVPALPCSTVSLLYTWKMDFLCLAKGLWQLKLLILILWLFPPLPSEQITATIEMFFLGCSWLTWSIQTGQRWSFALLSLGDETDKPTHLV